MVRAHRQSETRPPSLSPSCHRGRCRSLSTVVAVVSVVFQRHCQVAIGAVTVDQQQHMLLPARQDFPEPGGSAGGRAYRLLINAFDYVARPDAGPKKLELTRFGGHLST